ncbi:TIR domain-containing protein [Dyadobacter sp. CY261]|uniref:TIR domain-containing protein n=1 Tax=Dyadobacter sp. CY261 TaxID=2907203 RepID=UPI001F386C36|nr:TIR domain-containing protein [Dyadobacter sp. CY261]MCF0072222.1 TIR domain-containing protein [Dyadobacter sp. CY261]
MIRKVFFSFHYKRDSHRVAQIRNSQVVSNGDKFQRTPFLDKAEFEQVKRTQGIQKWIDENMKNTSVVVVCYGLETSIRPWVKYELEKAHREGRGIVAINTSGMQTLQNSIDASGINPLVTALDEKGLPLILNDKYLSYHWINETGRTYIGDWIEKAAKLAGR